MTVRIIIPDDFPPAYAGEPELDDLRALGEVTLYGDRSATVEELLRRLDGAPFMINVRAYTPLNEQVLSALPDLRLIAVFGTGTDNIDLAAADRLGIVVTNAPGANARSVAEHTIALLFATVRAIPAHDRELRAGLWQHHDGVELEGKTIGVVGLGNIGGRVARMAGALDMRVLGWSLTHDEDRAARLGVTLVELDDLLRGSDIVSLNVALSDRTRGLIGARELALMKPGAFIINTARGALIDELALVAALREGRIAGAGLDVFGTEPLPVDNPLLALENVVVAPHTGWVTHEAKRRLLATPVRNIAEYLAGRPVNVVNPASLGHTRQRGNT
ncbi:MAG: 2-hydroxyacid dehydrogenase [Dehalococcoidia bacterium]